MTPDSQEQRYFRRNEAAQYLQENYRIPCSAKTLANLACKKQGPAFRHHGRFPIYSKDKLDEWALESLGVASEPPVTRANHPEAGK